MSVTGSSQLFAAALNSAENMLRDLESGKVTSVELVRDALDKAEQHSDANIFISLDKSGSLAAAERMDTLRQSGEILGPLHGVPIVVKDNIFVAGLPNTAGTPGFKEFIPDYDAGVVERIKSAGAIVLGKTNLHELAYGITSNNQAFGPVRNACNPDYIGGGSSGGTAVAVALGVTSLGLGTDTGGSSRIPAALNGIVGFRPTTGRYPDTGLTMISNTRDTVGPMAASVADVSLLDSVMSGSSDDPKDAKALQPASLDGLRLGVPRGYFYRLLAPDVAKAMEMLLEQLKASGVELVEADLEGMAELNEKVGFPIVLYETGELLKEFLAKHMPDVSIEELIGSIVSQDVKPIVQSAVNGDVPEAAYREALEVFRPQLQKLYSDYFVANNVEAIIFPTTPLPAIPIQESFGEVEIGTEVMPAFAAFIRHTDPGSNAGIPGLSIPFSRSDISNSDIGAPDKGLPIGVEIDGPAGSDRRLLSIGAAIEKLIAGKSGCD